MQRPGCRMMGAIQLIVKKPAQSLARGDNACAGDSGSNLRRAFFDCFSSYAAAVGRLWSEVASSQQPRLVGEGLSSDEKLLVLHSNCVHMRTFIFKELVARYS